VVGIEVVGQHPDDLAVRTSMMMPAAPLALKSLMTLLVLVKDELHAGVERELDRRRHCPDPAVERPSIPARPLLSIPQNPTTCASDRRTGRFGAPDAQLQTGDAEAIDLELLAGRQPRLIQNKALS